VSGAAKRVDTARRRLDVARHADEHAARQMTTLHCAPFASIRQRVLRNQRQLRNGPGEARAA
jgi:hypothetical protein